MKLVILEAKCLEARVITPFGAKCSYGLPETIGNGVLLYTISNRMEKYFKNTL